MTSRSAVDISYNDTSDAREENPWAYTPARSERLALPNRSKAGRVVVFAIFRVPSRLKFLIRTVCGVADVLPQH